MTDTLTPEQRSERMSRIRSKDTKPELALRSALHGMGFRFRVNARQLPGKPDIVLPKHRTVIFVHGCFWHRHEGCKVASTPKTNTGFWEEKFARNVERDRSTTRKLGQLGWEIMVVWECELKSQPLLRNKAEEIAKRLRDRV